MGIASWALGDDNPFAKYVADNKNLVHGAFAGLGQGKTFGQGLGQAALYAQQGGMADDIARQQAEEKAAKDEENTLTTNWLKTNYPQYSNLPVTQGWQLAMQEEAAKKSGIGGNAPSNVQEWEYFSQLPPEQQTQYLTMKRANSPLNLGNQFVTQDPANPGATIGAPIAINNQQAEYDKGFGRVEGTTDAENVALYESVSSKMPGLKTVVDQLAALSDTATYTQSGQAMDAVKREFGLPVGQGAIDRTSYMAIVDNQVLPLLKDTFGAAFTVQEGESLRATLGNPNLSPPEKKAVLDAFIAQKVRSIEAMQRNLPAGASAAPVVRVFNPATGRLE